jgi:hypothetical protein
MSVAELTKLIYRDHIPMKHASRKRLSDEISTIENSRACERPLQRPALEEASADTGTDLLSQLLVKYLMQVSVFIKTSSVPARSNNFVQDWAGLTFQQLDNNNQQVFQVFLVFFCGFSLNFIYIYILFYKHKHLLLPACTIFSKNTFAVYYLLTIYIYDILLYLDANRT